MHEHVGSLHELVGWLETGLATRSIMTPWADVDCVEVRDTAAATALMDAHRYSGVPLVCPESGRVLGMYVRGQPGGPAVFDAVQAEHFVEPSLGLVALIRLLRDTKKFVVGVGSAESPLGWLTYADFSKRPFRVLLFAIVAEVEYLLAAAIDRAHPDDTWVHLVPESAPELLRRMADAEHWDVTMPLTTFTDIGHLVSVVGQSPEVRALLNARHDIADKLRSLSQVRNRVAHVVRPVVPGPGQIASVARQIELMLGWISGWTARLAEAP